MWTKHISTTYIFPRPIIPSHLHISLHTLPRRHNYPQLKSGILNLHNGSANFFTRHQGFPNFTNRCCGHPNNLQLTPRLPETFSTNSGDFKPASRILWGCTKYWLPEFSGAHVGSNGHLNDQNIGCLFYDCTACANFSVKTNTTRVLILFVLVPQLILRINTRKNHLNKTALSQYVPFYLSL